MFIRFVGLLMAFTPLIAEAGVWDSVRSFFSRTHEHPTTPTIDVLIVNDQPGAMVEVRGKYKIYDPNLNKHVATRHVGKGRMMEPLATGLRWGEEFPGIYQLELVPDDKVSKILINGTEYTGSVFIYDIGGSISVVNRVKIEDFLRSTLSRQFYEPLPEEALSAIAIVARTYALYNAKNKKNPYWAVDASQVGYEGKHSVDEQSRIIDAIQMTYNMVLSETGAYEGEVTPIAAQWGSGSGGRVSNQNAVFAHISLFDAEDMANNGADASRILSRAFPGTHIELVR